MRHLAFFIFLLGVTNSFSQDAFVEGNQKYREEHYKTALKSYETLIDSVNRSSEILYNLGNAYYKTKQIGKAIWAYESALKIDPKNEDAKFNLEFANLQTADKIEQPKPALTEWLKRLLFGPQINLWASISVACSFALSLMILLFFMTKSRRRRNISLMGGMTFALLLIFSTVAAFFHKNSILQHTEGIIISEAVDVRLSPLEKANVTFELHEGAKVNLQDENEEWLQIEVGGNSGWVLKEEVWEI